MQKNKLSFMYYIMYFAMFSILLSAILPPQHAFAYTIPTSPPTVMLPPPPPVTTPPTPRPRDQIVYICPSNDPLYPDKGFTSRLIPCIRDTVIFATSSFIIPFSTYLANTINAAITLAIVTWGILLLSGTATSMAYISQRGFILLLKIGAVVVFTNNFGDLYPSLLSVLEDILNIIARPAAAPDGLLWRDASCTVGTFQPSEQDIMTVWTILDCYIDLFLGNIFNPLNIVSGIIGFVIAALFSTSIGLFISLMGIYLIMLALFTIARAVYIFVSSYIAFSFMVILSSIFIPCILFESTKKYFDAWLRITVSFLLQPVLLFGYLVMFLVAFNVSIFHEKYSLYYAIAGDKVITDPAFKLGDWLNANGVYNKQLQSADNLKIQQKAGTILTDIRSLPEDTGVADIQGGRADPVEDNQLGVAGNPLNFFQTGILVNVINWERLAERARPTEFGAITTQAGINEFYRQYKISIFIAFMSAMVTIYVFYSLLNYLPYIGNATLGAGGGAPMLGIGKMALPGSRYFGGKGA